MHVCLRSRVAVALLGGAALLAAPVGRADVAPEKVGEVQRLPQPAQPHWAWVSDLILGRTALIDTDGTGFLGMINGGYGTIMPLFPSRRAEIYLPATYYSRGTRGTRTDVFEVWDAATLSPLAEVPLPPKRATNAVALAHAALSDDDRFAAVFNWTTGTSLSIVDVEQRSFAGEIPLPGCSLVFAAGARRFLSICGDGAAFTVTLDEQGHEATRAMSTPFFDPRTDPVTEKAARWRDQWVFVTFDGRVHAVDVSGPELRFAEPWSLLSDADREQNWRIGGMQHLAIHQSTGRLYVLVHQGGPDTHKEPGEEVWIYDLAERQRVARVELVSPGFTIYGFPVDFGGGWPAPFNRLSGWMLNALAPAAVAFIQVTQDRAPLLITASQFSGSLGVYDALTGEFLRRVQPTGWTSDVILAPYGGSSAP
jgi:methylamine dehydrogenase heavy chain